MEIKNMQYWKRKNALPGLNYESENKLPNGLAKSSALQKTEEKGIRNPKASTKPPTAPVPPKKSTAKEKTVAKMKDPKARKAGSKRTKRKEIIEEGPTNPYKPKSARERLEEKIKERPKPPRP